MTMPPKGWRKNTEGQAQSNGRNPEPVSVDDILFPKSITLRLAKSVVNNGDGDDSSSNMLLAKDSVQALQRSATVFVSHILFQARQFAKSQNRKTVNTHDIINALEKAEFKGFVPGIKQKLDVYENLMQQKKQENSSSVKGTSGGNSVVNGETEQATHAGTDDENHIGEGKSTGQNEAEDDDEDEDIEDEDEAYEAGEPDNEQDRIENPIELVNKEEKELLDEKDQAQEKKLNDSAVTEEDSEGEDD
ncbi:Piso0_000878 [Millerozyma farinosa CBS 7064]|uniref:DNA polymerase epsilon subunit D n=1 Tax=Pichia sorbitophila (strain ATCC MYA-4447 / BCRC 22081 / CBS 7064 / NBRC 10061 / NRRL Y-12695) TaxID=559304 RepID=G8YQB1_PICSO|nr:Piso0_000878 [Millerozyma farinosa CBS 7064]